MRRIVAVVAAAVLSGSVVVAAVPAHAAPTAARSGPAAGTYVPLARPLRALDTRTKAGGGHAVAAGHTISPRIAGVAGVPASGAASVAVTVTALTPTGTGGLVAYRYGSRRPTTTNLQFAAGQRAVSDTAVVTLSGGSKPGRISIANFAATGTVQVVVDVSGYFAAGTPSAREPGIFHSVTPQRVVDTRSGAAGSREGALGAGKTLAAKIGGHAGVPSEIGAAAVTVTVVSSTAGGTIEAGRPDEPRQPYPYVHFGAHQTVSSFAVLRAAGGVTNIVNTSHGSVHVVVDVVGYYSLGFAERAGQFQTRIQTRAQTSTVPADGDLDVHLGGKGGVERSGVSSATITLHAESPRASGGLQVWRSGAQRPSPATALQFTRAVTASNVVLVPTTRDGTFRVHNTSAAPVTVAVDIAGYVPTTDSPALPGAGRARYLGTLTGRLADDRTRMGGYGNQDGASRPRFVLLDVGAQSVTTPVLSKSSPGVSLALTKSRVPYRYADLVTLVRTYLDGLVASLPAGSAPPVVTVGTSNDGVWDATKPDYYAPADRGRDWATQVIEPLDGYAGVKVRGADDIEPGFASTVGQALDWEKAFLAASRTRTPKLYFNGSSDGCPVTWRPGACAYGWTQSQLYDLASQPGVVAVPQIYTGSQATQWAGISAAGGRDGSGKGALRFAGILSEYSLDHDFLTPPQAASALTRALRSVGSRPLPAYVADFADN